MSQSFCPVSEESLTLLRLQRGEIIAKATRRALTFRDEIDHHGPEAEQLISTGFDFTLKAIEMAMQFSDAEVLGQQIAWGMDRLPHDGVAPEHVLHRFEILAEVISTLLPPPHAQAANQYLQWIITEQQKRMAKDE